MRGELIFDTKDLVIMKDKDVDDCLYAIDRKTFNDAEEEYFSQLRIAHPEDKRPVAPDLEAILIVEKDPGKFDLGNVKKKVNYDEMIGVLISLV